MIHESSNSKQVFITLKLQIFSEEAHKANYDDAEWTDVDLPHDYSINREFSTSNEAESGFLPGGVSWYRKRFIAPEELKNKNVLFGEG